MLYHVTSLDNLESILCDGLIPQIGPRSQKINDAKAIYLFRSLLDAVDGVCQWLGDEFPDDIPLVLLKIDNIDHSNLVDDNFFEIKYTDIIDPSCITVVSYNF